MIQIRNPGFGSRSKGKNLSSVGISFFGIITKTFPYFIFLSKGWRRVLVETEEELEQVQTPSDDTATTSSTILEDSVDKEQLVLIEQLTEKLDPTKAEPRPPSTPENDETPIVMRKTACGDYHNLGLDTLGRAYSLPSPLSVSSFPGSPALKVADVACGKEHCMLLTEMGQVFSWGGGSRGQLGHGGLASEQNPRLIMALDGMKIIKVGLMRLCTE